MKILLFKLIVQKAVDQVCISQMVDQKSAESRPYRGELCQKHGLDRHKI